MKAVRLEGPVRVALDRALTELKAAEASGDALKAASVCLQVAKLMASYAEYAATREDELRRREKARWYVDRAAALKDGTVKVGAAPAVRQGSSRPAPRTEPSESAGADGQFAQEIRDLIHRSSVEWDDIGGLDATKREIQFAYGIALATRPEGVKYSGWRRILFYGPPGTGKTLLAAAMSNSLGATFFNVKASSLLSKWFGESSRLISALFDVARSQADEGFSVVFIDEAESLCLPRGEGADSGAERRMLSTLLSELDGLKDKGQDRYVMTIAATNAPWDLDDAVLSRFQKRIYIPLPDAPARQAILDLLLSEQGVGVDYGVDQLVERTACFSGRDLERLTDQAVSAMIEQMNPDVPRLVTRGREAIEAYQLNARPLTRDDFDAAFALIKVDVDRQRELEVRFREFAARN